MANVSKPAGFAPVKMLSGADWDGRGNLYSIDSGDGNAFYQGDLVKLSGTGDTKGIPGVTLGTAGATAVGVLLAAGIFSPGGPYVNPNNLGTLVVPATKAQNYYALVVDDPNVIFEIQEGGSGTLLATTNIGENIDILYAAGTVLSGMTINNGAHDTTSTRNCKLLSLVQRADNAFGIYSKWWVMINNHSFRAGITGI